MRRAARKYGLREAGEGEDWTLFWTDCSVSLDRVMEMKLYQVITVCSFSTVPASYTNVLFAWFFICEKQKINHFPGMSEICRKDLLSRNMNRMLKLFPKDYNIFPRTWCLPAEWVLSPTSIENFRTGICVKNIFLYKQDIENICYMLKLIWKNKCSG